MTALLPGGPAATPAGYRLLEELGRGASSVVFLAVHSESGRQVVLKLLGEELEKASLRRFAREVRTLRSLDHPCIVRILDAGDATGRPWYAMEHLARRPLDRVLHERYRVRHSSVRIEEARETLRDVGAGLLYAHARKVVHRDLKPSNVLVDAEFHATIIDFGVARLDELDITRLTATGDFLGTPAYAAPEQLERGVADARTDVYAYGLLAYELLTGALPFPSETPIERLRLRGQRDIPPPSATNPTVGAGLDRVILRCLAADPAERYPAVEGALADLEKAFAGERPDARAVRRSGASGPAAFATGAATEPASPPSVASPRSPLWRVALVALMLSAGGAAWMVRSFGPDRVTPAGPGAPGETAASGAARVEQLVVVTSPTSATVEFGSAEPVTSWAEYRTGEGPWIERSVSPEPASQHRVTLLGLAPAREHELRILLEDARGRRFASETRRFRTREVR